MSGDGTEGLQDAVREELPLAIGEVLAPLIHSAVRSEMRWWRRCAIAGYLVLVLGLGYGIHDNRERATTARGVICQIITKGDQALYAYRHEGKLTERQLRRALAQSVEYRKLLGPAPACSASLTPEPKRLPPPRP